METKQPEQVKNILPFAQTGLGLESSQSQSCEQDTQPFQGKQLWMLAAIPERHKYFKAEQSKSEAWSLWFNGNSEKIDKGNLIGIIGTRGAGKTQMGICLIREACKKNLSSFYIKAMDIFIEMRENFGTEKSERKTILKYCDFKFLVIDAVENRGETDFENRLLSHIIDKRYDACLDTVLISNQEEVDFLKSMGSSIVSRMNETGGLVICNWKSFR
jgi:DNA replication protein DnaC